MNYMYFLLPIRSMPMLKKPLLLCCCPLWVHVRCVFELTVLCSAGRWDVSSVYVMYLLHPYSIWTVIAYCLAQCTINYLMWLCSSYLQHYYELQHPIITENMPLATSNRNLSCNSYHFPFEFMFVIHLKLPLCNICCKAGFLYFISVQ